MTSLDMNPNSIRRNRTSLCALASGLAVGLVAASLALSPVVMSGCKKEEPPKPVVQAPPPPPDVPPPPPAVNVKTVLQQLKADKRVQIADGVSTTKEPLARAIIQFADAFAKGDKAKLGAMLDPSGKRILDTLAEDGKWEEETKKIEAVRIVSLRPGGDPGLSVVGGETKLTRETIRTQLRALLAMMDKMPAEMKDKAKQEFGGDIPTDPDAFMEVVVKKAAEYKASGETPPPNFAGVLPMVDAWQNAEDAKPPAPSADEPDGPYSLVLAIQEPGVAYARGWVAVPMGGKWVFKASPNPMLGDKARASDFDNADEAPPPPPMDAPAPEKTEDDKPTDGGGGDGGGKGGSPTGG